MLLNKLLKYIIKTSINFDKLFIINNSSEKKIFVITFHSVHLKKDQSILSKYLNPYSSVSIENLEKLIYFLLKNNIKLINSQDLESDNLSILNVIISFDDGYYNNHHIIDLVKNYDIPIEVFVSTSYIENQSLYWWDILYCANKNPENYKHLKHSDILKKSNNCFKHSMFSDINRPFNVSELKEFSNNKNIIIGNHTHTHMISNLINEKYFIADVLKAQDNIKKWTGYKPISFAFPNGNFLSSHFEPLKKMGLQYNFKLFPDYIDSSFLNNEPLPRYLLNPKHNFISEFESILKISTTYKLFKALYFLRFFKSKL